MRATSVCETCGYVGRPDKELRGSGALELVLLLCGVVPGLAYGWWRHSGPTFLCPRCRQLVIPVESPEGRALLASRPHGPEGLSQLEQATRVVKRLPLFGGVGVVALMLASVLFPSLRREAWFMWLVYAAGIAIAAHPLWYVLDAILSKMGRDRRQAVVVHEGDEHARRNGSR